MRRKVDIVIILMLVLCSVFSFRVRISGQEGNKRPVDLRSDRIFPVPVGDSTGYALTGNVILYHNGTVITCDSMVRYDARHMDCFGKVVINQDSLYVYGDRAEYNGDTDMARIYSPLIKMTDGNAVMYTYNFSFNTRTNIGEFTNGGTISQDDYLMEAEQGYYYANDRIMVGVGNVQMRSPSYVMESDSVSYNLNTEQVTFHKRSNIWNDKDEILSADSGDYFKTEDRYKFYSNAYILTEENELWADSIDYVSDVDNIEMWNNIQAVDEENHSMAFGDYARYIGNIGKGLLTDNPSVLRYEEDGTDTLYMRSDTIYVYQVDSLGYFELNRSDSASVVRNSLPDQLEEAFSLDDYRERFVEETIGSDSIEVVTTAPSEKLSKRELRRLQKEQERNEKQAARRERKKQKEDKKRNEVDIEPETYIESEVPGLDSLSSDDMQSIAVTLESKLGDSLAIENIEEVERINSENDGQMADSLASEEGKKDKTDRVVVAYNNVKIFRKDFQAVCDSLLGFTVDSTIEMHVNPILWSETSQITSDDVQIFTENQQLKEAIFTGNPIMASEVDTIRYNQVNGKTITAFFNGGNISRVDVNGNAKTYYYMVDDSDDTVQGFLDAVCADLTFNIEENRVVKIVFRTQPEYTIYPMDQIPSNNTQRFDGFTWQGKSRPTVEQVFNREIRPSERAYYINLEKPEFIITRDINTLRSSLVEAGLWVDRDDLISEDTMYFISTREQ